MNNAQNNSAMNFEAGQIYVSDRAIELGYMEAMIEVVRVTKKSIYIKSGMFGKSRRLTIEYANDGAQFVKAAKSPYAPNIFADNR